MRNVRVRLMDSLRLFAKEGSTKTQTQNAQPYLDNTKYTCDRQTTELQKTATPEDQLFKKSKNS